MSTPNSDGLKIEIDQGRMRVGNQVQLANGLPAVSIATPLYMDASSNLATAPIALPLVSGTVSTSASVLSIEGSATGSANELMHLTLVSGANATSTIAGFYRITVIDDAGVVTNGEYYAPFYTLS